MTGTALAIRGRREEQGCPAMMGIPLQHRPVVLGSHRKESQREGFCFQCIGQLLVAAAKNAGLTSTAKRNSVQGSFFSIPV